MPSLWNGLSDDVKERLRQFQWDKYHEPVNPPDETIKLVMLKVKTESLNEIMRRPPRRPRK